MPNKCIYGVVLAMAIVLSSTLCQAGEPTVIDEAWKTYCSEDLSGAARILNKAVPQTDSGTFNVAYLRARIAAASFKKYFHENDLGGRTLKPDEARKVKELSLEVTRRYEDAYKVAADRYTRACITAEWWPLYGHYQFQECSDLLMGASPAALAKDVPPSLATQIKRQTRVFRAAFRGTLDIVQGTENMEDKRKDAFADSLSKEFASFAVVDIPDSVFETLLRDLPVYVNDYMWPPDAVAVPGTYRNTMRWDLWRAVTLIAPNRIESQVIHRQTQEFAKMVGKEMDDLIVHAKVQPQGKSYSERANKAYERMRDNRFVPYFHRYVMQYERRKCQEMLLADWKQVKGNWESDLADWAKESKPVPDSTYMDAANRYRMLVYSLAWLRFAHYRQPAWEGAIPNEEIILSGGRLNSNQVLSFTVQKVEDRVQHASTQPRQ